MNRDKIIKNKKGDIPVTILVIGVFVVCTLAIFSFIHASLVINKSFVGVGLMEKANIDIEKGSLESYYVDKTVKVLRPKLGSGWIEEKTIFSVSYQNNP